jgi:hypothetical protein
MLVTECGHETTPSSFLVSTGIPGAADPKQRE